MKIKLLLITFLSFQIAFSQTTVPGGIVNGIWTLAGSPYNIQGSIQIVNGDSLIIQPGVTVSFQGTYKLLVLGKLKAIGTITDTIIFTAADTSTGWRGIRFDNTPSTNDTSRIMYCKIQSGKASGGTAPDQVGGGIYFNNFSKAVVSYSNIVNCKADDSGGGIYSSGGSPIIMNCVISNNIVTNSSGGGVLCSGGSPKIINNTICLNSAPSGGGINCPSGTPTISNNIISNNNTAGQGGGIYCAGANPTIMNNTIIYNTANAGGGIHSYDATINNNIISNNTAQEMGGGINCSFDPIITNNTISNNTTNLSSINKNRQFDWYVLFHI